MLSFAVVALLELAAFLFVESRIGLGNALLLALLTAVVGSALVRRAGVAVLADIRRRLSQGAMPARELTHGAAVLVSGALLISPGFFTDIIGFSLLVPAVRDRVHEIVSRRYAGRITVAATPSSAGWTGPTTTNHEVIDVTGWEEL